MVTVRPIKVRVDKDRGAWFAQLDRADERGVLRGHEFASGDEEDGRIEWLIDIELDLPRDVTRAELEAALAAECERLDRHGYTCTSELDRHLKEGRLRAACN